MVSGVTDIHHSYKTNKGYYSAPTQPPSQGTKRFSDSPALRPWPPMYKSSSRPSSNGTANGNGNGNGNGNYHLSSNLNFNKINNGMYSNNSVYSRNKFNFHPLNGGKYSSSVNLTNIKNAKNYFLVSQPYMKNSMILPATPFYGRDSNLLMVNKELVHHNNPNTNSNGSNNLSNGSEKGRFRKLRHPTQQSPPQRSCACVRSKSMEDVRTEIVTDWAAYNNKDSFNHFGKMRNGLSNGKSNTRRSMDNLLDVDTAYGKHFQVCFYIYRFVLFSWCVLATRGGAWRRESKVMVASCRCIGTEHCFYGWNFATCSAIIVVGERAYASQDSSLIRFC